MLMKQAKQNVIYIKTTNKNNVQAALKIADETFILRRITSSAPWDDEDLHSRLTSLMLYVEKIL